MTKQINLKTNKYILVEKILCTFNQRGNNDVYSFI